MLKLSLWVVLLVAGCGAAIPRQPTLTADEPGASRRVDPQSALHVAADLERLPAEPDASLGLQAWLAIAGQPHATQVSSASFQNALNTLDALSTTVRLPDALAEHLIGHRVLFGYDSPDGQVRSSGFVQEATCGAQNTCDLRIAPWYWLLTRTATCAIFQNQTGPEILQAVFARYPFARYEMRLHRSYPVKEYAVQYRETDLNFADRLIEDLGIAYFFEQRPEGEVLVLVDDMAGFESASAQPFKNDGPVAKHAVTNIEMRASLQPSQYTVADLDPAQVGTALAATAVTTEGIVPYAFSMFDFPGEYSTPAEGRAIAQMRLDELRTQARTLDGTTASTLLTTGKRFVLDAHPTAGVDGEYLVTRSNMMFEIGELVRGIAPDDQLVQTRFEAIPASVVFRPARTTPMPMIDGPQVALVVGPRAGAPYTDGEGRIRVRFLWDRREGASPDESSAWIPVLQPVNAPAGAWQVPVVGEQVLVTFLEGLSNRPIVTGIVPHGRATVGSLNPTP